MPIISIPIQESTPIGKVRYQDLVNWLSTNCQGMYEVKTTYGPKSKIWSVVVSFINDKDAALFKLRWS
jgi:hypothetical protein